MSIFRTIALFIYLFGYMIVHYARCAGASVPWLRAIRSWWKNL